MKFALFVVSLADNRMIAHNHSPITTSKLPSPIEKWWLLPSSPVNNPTSDKSLPITNHHFSAITISQQSSLLSNHHFSAIVSCWQSSLFSNHQYSKITPISNRHFSAISNHHYSAITNNQKLPTISNQYLSAIICCQQSAPTLSRHTIHFHLQLSHFYFRVRRACVTLNFTFNDRRAPWAGPAARTREQTNFYSFYAFFFLYFFLFFFSFFYSFYFIFFLRSTADAAFCR